MPRFRKKPEIVEAVQWTGKNPEEIALFALACASFSSGDPSIDLTIVTVGGVMTCSHGDWIIRGVKGEFYPCGADRFEQTYERADA